MKKVVERQRNKNYYRALHIPLWVWAFWVLPGNLTADLYAHGPDRRHWIWLAIVTAVCIWRCLVGRLPGCEPAPYITHYGEEKPNLWYRVICYTTAWIDLLVPFTINLIGLVVASLNGGTKWIIHDLYGWPYWIMAATIVLATILDVTPRARRSTRGEGSEKAWFYVTVWMVVPAQAAGLLMWRLGKIMNLNPANLAVARLAAFAGVAALFLILGLLQRMPRTQRYYVPKGIISDVPVSAGA